MPSFIPDPDVDGAFFYQLTNDGGKFARVKIPSGAEPALQFQSAGFGWQFVNAAGEVVADVPEEGGFPAALPIVLPDNSLPSIVSAGDETTGWGFTDQGVPAVFLAGTETLSVESDGIYSGVPFITPDGDANAPAFANASDPTTGIYFPVIDAVAISSAGVRSFAFAAGQGLMNAGTEGAPALAFDADPTTGFWMDGTAVVISNGGTENARFTSGGGMVMNGNLELTVGNNFITAGAVFTSTGPGTPAEWKFGAVNPGTYGAVLTTDALTVEVGGVVYYLALLPAPE
jgi:hypothetical protein